MWGYAGVWHGDFGCWNGDETMNKLRFLSEHGFECGSIGLGELRDPERREQITRFVAEHDLKLEVNPHIKWLEADDDALKLQTDQFLDDLRRHAQALRTPIVTTCVGPYHRFMSDPPLEEQLQRLSQVLTPIALGCKELGIPFGIENHGDYYCSDLVCLCRGTPHLGIFLDTGNTYLIGEKSVAACLEAAPYTIGAHFKDHMVAPRMKAGELAFGIEGAALGEGHVGLAEVYRALLDRAPSDLVLLWEMIPPRTMGGLECLERSWEFVRNLPEE